MRIYENHTISIREVLFALITLAVIEFCHAGELYPGQYAQVPAEIQEWFRTQKVPGSDATCCSQSDGVHGEQDMRNGQYWTRFIINYHVYDCSQANEGGCLDNGIKSEQIEWVPVPDNVILHNSRNPYLTPIIWWHREEGMPKGVRIRCYVPAGES